MNGDLPERAAERRITLRQVVCYVSLVSIAAGVIFFWMLLRKPQLPPGDPDPEAAASFNAKILRLTAAQEARIPAEVRFTAAELNSQIQAWLKANPPPEGTATVKNGTVRLAGDRLVTVLAVNVKGVDLYLTVDGRLEFANHSARLVPLEVHIGSVPVPASWLAGKIDMHMELPDAITAVRVENGELVVEAD